MTDKLEPVILTKEEITRWRGRPMVPSRWEWFVESLFLTVEDARSQLRKLATAAVCPHGCRMCPHYESVAIEALRDLGL